MHYQVKCYQFLGLVKRVSSKLSSLHSPNIPPSLRPGGSQVPNPSEVGSATPWTPPDTWPSLPSPSSSPSPCCHTMDLKSWLAALNLWSSLSTTVGLPSTQTYHVKVNDTQEILHVAKITNYIKFGVFKPSGLHETCNAMLIPRVYFRWEPVEAGCEESEDADSVGEEVWELACTNT